MAPNELSRAVPRRPKGQRARGLRALLLLAALGGTTTARSITSGRGSVGSVLTNLEICRAKLTTSGSNAEHLGNLQNHNAICAGNGVAIFTLQPRPSPVYTSQSQHRTQA